MKIKRLHISGFRGIRDEFDLEIPQGFLVICGRNGSGKSTLCDAIEFALTGTIRPTFDLREKGETFEDYLWWRGAGEPKEKIVKVDFIRDNGDVVSIERTQNNSEVPIPKDQFCHIDIAPADPIRQLIQTTMIRDEEITRFGVDLSERARFDFAKKAIAKMDFQRYIDRAQELSKLVASRIDSLNFDYKQIRERVSELTARVSSLRTEAESSGNISAAQSTIGEILGQTPTNMPDILDQARSYLIELRVRIERSTALSRELQKIDELLKDVDTDSNKKTILNLEVQIRDISLKRAALQSESEKITEEIAQQEPKDPMIKSLAELHFHGEKLGLSDGHCPLCGSEVSEKDYASHLLEIDNIVKAASTSLSNLISNKNQIIRDLNEIDKNISMLQAQYHEKSNAKSEIEKRYQNIITHSWIDGVSVDKGIESNLKELHKVIESARISLSKLEQAVVILEASKAFEKVVELERELTLAKEEGDKISQRIALVTKIQERVRLAQNTIQRISGEIVDEQLSEMSPLLSEIFVRLRPHVDWKEVNYRLRGDVRRFLSLNVGGELNLNPSFLFSSGQRRALGLAFLLTIHLARRWSKLKTLILDDPVQHIDDYRALHLAEVLAAIRKQGHQIICTVEDQALANLLCRRLRSKVGEEGALVNLEYKPGSGVEVKSMEFVRPLQEAVLKAS